MSCLSFVKNENILKREGVGVPGQCISTHSSLTYDCRDRAISESYRQGTTGHCFYMLPSVGLLTG